MRELGTQAVGEPAHRMLRAAIRRLERDRAVGERGSDLDDHAAVARPHSLQGRHGAVYLARYVTSVARRNSSGSISQNGAKIVAIAAFTQAAIGPSSLSRARGGVFDLAGVGDVRGQREPAAAERLGLSGSRLARPSSPRATSATCAPRPASS